MNRPAFITFTGLDDHTDMVEARELASQYPVEYGILFSPDRQGNEARYPSWGTVYRILQLVQPTDRYSAHLCGGYSRQLLASAGTNVDSLLREHFSRAQINTSQRGIDTAAIAQWAEALGVTPILQCRDAFPLDENVEWLFDTSGGRGVAPAAWPMPPALGMSSELALCGYAGGLNPGNVAAAIAAIGEHDEHYWIDMESGVRDGRDRLDLSKCRAVCEAVFGVAP